jgi:DNA replication licensing factor MCM3
LTEDAVNLLSNLWTLLRQEDFTSNTSNRVLPITIRSYETLIRLSTAHAKLHQNSEVKIRDCIEAFRLMVYSLHGDSNALDDKLRDIMKKLGLNEMNVEKSE